MAEKNMVIKITSDAKQFVKGMEEALNMIESAAKKADSFDKITQDTSSLQEQLIQVAKQIKDIESASKSGNTELDSQVESLQRNVENLNKKFDSFRHTFKTLQETVKGLNTKTIELQMEKLAHNLDLLIGKYTEFQKISNNLISTKVNVEDIKNIEQLKKAFSEALIIFEDYSKKAKTDKSIISTEEYQNAAKDVYEYAKALEVIEGLVSTNKNLNIDFSNLVGKDIESKMYKTADSVEKILSNSITEGITDKIYNIFENVDIDSFINKIQGATGTIESGTKGFLVKGAIEIPVKLKEDAKRKIAADVGEIIGNAQRQVDETPILFNFNPIGQNENKLYESIKTYYGEIATLLQEQAEQLNATMAKTLQETGVKETQKDFEGISNSITQLLAKLRDFSTEVASMEKATDALNKSFSAENLQSYINAIKTVSENFKTLNSSLDDVSSKLSGNGLEGQFDLIKKSFSDFTFGDLTDKESKKNKLKELRELMTLYSTYQSRGGIRPFSDLLAGEADEGKVKQITSAYKEYIKTKEQASKSQPATSVPESSILDKKYLESVLLALKEIKLTIENIGKIDIDIPKLIETISKIQSNNSTIPNLDNLDKIVDIWSYAIQNANDYSDAVSLILESLDNLSNREINLSNINLDDIKNVSLEIQKITQLLEKGFGIASTSTLENSFENIKNKYNSLLDEKGNIDLRKQKDSLNELIKLYYEYQKLGGTEKLTSLTDNKKNQQKLSDNYKKYLEELNLEEKRIKDEANNGAKEIEQTVIKVINNIKDNIKSIQFDIKTLVETIFSTQQIDYSDKINDLKNNVSVLSEILNILKQINNIPQKIDTGIEFTGDAKDSLKILTELEKRMPPVEEGFSRIVHMTSSSNAQNILDKGLSLPTSDLSQHSLFMKQYINDAQRMAQGLETTFNTLGILSGRFGDTAVIMDIPTEEVKGYSNAINGLDEVSTNYVRGTLNLSQSLITLNENFGKSTTTIEAFAKAIYEAKQNEANLQSTNNVAPIMPAMSRSFQLMNSANRIFGEERFSQYYSQYEKTQEEINNTKEASTIASQEIIDAIDRVKNSLSDIIGMLSALKKEMINVSNNKNVIDYSNRISNIKRGITTLNKSIQELVTLFSQLDFDKINNIKISPEPFDKISSSLKEIVDLIERISGLSSKSNLTSQFEYIQSLYNSMVNDKGNFIVKGNKGKMQLLYSLFDEYKNAGGQMSLHRLTDSHVNQTKLYKYYEDYLSKLSVKEPNVDAEKTDLSNIFTAETNKYKDIEQAITQANSAKDKYIKKDKNILEQIDKTVVAIDKEKESLKNFTSEINTLVNIDIGENKIVQFNKDVLESVKGVVDGLKEETELVQGLSKINLNSSQKKTSETSNKKNKTQTNTQTESKGNVRNLVREQVQTVDEVIDADPYLTAFNEFLFLAAEEAERLKANMISVAEFDQSLSDILTSLYAEIPDLEDISASTGYGSNFNVTKASVIFRNKETNDLYKKSFALKQDKDSGEFYIDQTTAILNDAEKYGKDNEKQAQKILEWQTKLNAWLQNFSNKTSGTLNLNEDYQALKNFDFSSEKDWINIKTIQQRLEGLYNEIVSNSRQGSSSLSPVPNMMFAQESRLTKMQKAFSTYDKMALTWNSDDGYLENTEHELTILTELYKELQNQITTFHEDGSNIKEVSEAFGAFNKQLNVVNEQLNRMKIINTEINGNKINNLNQWFKDMPNPNEIEVQELGKISKYSEMYNQFAEAQERLQILTTNLSKEDDDYQDKKQQIHEIVLELEQMKKVLSSDGMNISNQMGTVIKQNIPEVNDVKELDSVINEYIKDLGVLQNSIDVGLKADKEGNEFAKFTREIKDAKGVVTEFEFTYDKAMGTIAVATKKVQEPEGLLKTITDELNTKWRGLFTTLLSFTGFYRLWGYFKQGISTVREFDDALTEMQKVSDNTIQTLQEYQKTTFDTADAIGATALQIQNSTADFMRLGESLKEAAESAKAANILMNVSEFESINEATKSLIAMGAAYKDLDKMTIIDKLNEVGNNYAISTSEAATALQSSASALKTAKNDMDESLALITAGNAVVQDANKVGTGMRTIALRLTGTKSAKEELEELGEETENIITTQSKLRDVIKEATAVASNEYKGFDILDDNGNYKSTYEIMLGIAEVYDEILETDKKFGRNNANLLLENVAGKTRANIAASIFQNPQLLKDAYKSSQEAENSAMEENEKYLNSISGHIAQLQNAYQEVWANSMNRDTINFFIDLGKNILNVVDDIGLLGTAFTTIVGARSIVGLQNNKGFAVIIAKWVKSSLKELARMDGAIGSLATSAIGFGKSFTSSFASAIPIIGGVATAIGLVGVAIYGAIKHYEKLRQEAVNVTTDMGKEWQQQKQSLSEYASQYEELKNKLKSGNLSEEETLETKQQIYDIQKSITEEYGVGAGEIDLINGKLQDQLNILKSISQTKANEIWQSEDFQEGFRIAQDKLMNPKELRVYANNEKIQEILDKYLTKGVDKNAGGYGTEVGYYGTFGDAYKQKDQLLDAIKEIEDLQKNTPAEEVEKYFDGVLIQMRTHLDDINKIITENEETVLNGLEVQLNKNANSQGALVYDNYKKSIADLESAYVSGNTKKIEEARKAFDEANMAKLRFLTFDNNNQFAPLFDNIDASLVKTKNKAYDAINAIKKSMQIDEETSRFDDYEERIKKVKDTNTELKKAHLDKFGNVDNTDRPIIFWNKEEIEKQEDALKSWGKTSKDVIGSFSTALGASGEFDGVEIAYTPIINDGTGKGKLLTKETLNNYIRTLIDNAGENWTNEDLLKLDTQGLIVDGQKISNIIAQISDTVSGDTGRTAQQVGEQMHFLQEQSLGYIADYQYEWEEAIKQGKTLEEYMADQKKDLKDVTKATGKYTKEDKQLYQALKKVIDLNMDRVDAELVFDKNASSSEDYSNALYNLIDVLGWTADDANLLIDTLVDTGYIQGSLSDAVDAASVSYNEYASAISTATENLSVLQNVLTESDSGKGLTNTTLDQFKKAFGDDAIKALENTANGIRANRDAIRELGEQQNKSLRTTHLEALNAQYTALQKVYEGYKNALNNGDATTPFVQQEKAIRDEIANLELLEAQWRGTSSAYQQWLNSQSSSKPQDMYSNIVSGYETVEDLIARGWWSDPAVRNYLDLVLEDSFNAQEASADELKERFESLDKTIEGTKFTLHDFFMTDEKGNLVVDGLNNFEDALKQIQDKYYPDKNWLSYDEDGNAIFDFTNGGNKEVADALGIGTEFLDILISAMESAGGFEIKLDIDDANKNLDELKQTAVEAKDSLNLNEKINLDPTSVEEADKSINALKEIIDDIKNDDEIELETKTDQLEDANKILDYLIEDKNQLIQTQFGGEEGIHLIDVNELEAADKKIEKIMNRPIKDGFDFSNFDLDSIEGLESAKNTISSMINDMSLSPDVDDSKVQYLNELLDAIQAKLDIINGAGTNGAKLTLGEYKVLDETVTSIKQQIEEGQAATQKGFHISWSSDKEFYETLDKINNLDPDIKAKFGLEPDKTTEELIDMVENGETIFIETKTKGAVPTPVQDETRTINTQENVTLGVTTVGTDAAEEAIRRIEEKNGTESTIVLNAESNVEEVQQGLQETQEESKQLDAERPDVTATLDDKATSPLNSLRNLITDTDGMSATVFSYYKDPDNAHYEISYIDSHVHDRTQTITTEYKTIGSPSGMGGVNGTAHVFGTAFAKGSINAYDNGDWGVSEDQTALVGELGTELLVRNGKWYDIGGQGAEFVNLRKGDIVFNSRQRDELFANGYVTSNGGRGRMIGGSSFAMGSVFSGGNAFANEAKRTRTTSSVKTKKAGSKNSTTSKGGGGSNGGGNGSRGGGNDNKSSDKAKETKNTLDEVEILIARIERQISRLDSRIANTYTTWARRNISIQRSLGKVSQEIKDQEDAYKIYINKAKSIGLPKEWVQKIHKGNLAIEDVIEKAKESGDTTDSLWDKITKYKEW